MEFSIFIWIISLILFLLSNILKPINKYIAYKLKSLNIEAYYFGGLLILFFALFLYLPSEKVLWKNLDNYVQAAINVLDISFVFLVKNIWHIIIFFRNIWLGILIACLSINIENLNYSFTGSYRTMKKFHHTKILLLVFSLFLYLVLRQFSYKGIFSSVLLNIVVYTAVYYWYFGFYTLLYIFKRSHIPYPLGLLILLLPIMMAGESFFLPLVACIGIGISDIWMDYHRRNAASLLFTFELR